MSINGEIETILREDLWITVDGDATAYIPDKDFDDATKKIVSLIKDRYVEKRRLKKYQPCGCVLCTCEDELRCHGCGAVSCGKHKVGDNKHFVFEDTSDYITRQEAYEKAVKWFSSDIPQDYPNEVLELTYKEKCLKALRTAFKIPEGKE